MAAMATWIVCNLWPSTASKHSIDCNASYRAEPGLASSLLEAFFALGDTQRPYISVTKALQINHLKLTYT